MEDGLTRRLTLLSAPAGWGKTTLLLEWLADGAGRPGHAAGWLSLDPEDNDPARFLTYLIAALETARPGAAGGAGSLIHPVSSSSHRTVLTALINGLAGLSENLTLVLDDYHAIESPQVHDALSFLIERMPPKAHIIAATRADPPFPIARLRARGELLELRSPDLRFTEEEAALFLNDAMHMGLTAEDVAALEARTEGWIAGLQLAAASMKGREDARDFIKAFTGSSRFVIDYLAQEILARQPDAVKDFLVSTSILGSLSGPLCDAVTGRTDGREILSMLELSNAFIVPLDQERRWYRYHTLFAEYLKSCLEKRGGAEDLHRKAAAWYRDNGFDREAIRHSLSAADFEEAALMIEGAYRQAVLRGETETLVAWLSALPAGMRSGRPRLKAAAAWAALSSGRLDDVEAMLNGGDARPAMNGAAGEAAALRALVAVLKGDSTKAITLSHQALEGLPAEDSFLRGLVTENLGLAYDTRGDIPHAEEAHAKALSIGRTAGYRLLTAMASAQLADIKALSGRLREAEGMYRQAVKDATEPEPLLPIAAMVHNGFSRMLYEWNELEDAARHAEAAADMGRRVEFSDALVTGLIALARVRQAQGEVASARECVREAEGRMHENLISAPTVALARAYHARLMLSWGDSAAASSWAAEYKGRPADAPGYPGYLRQLEGTTWVRVLLSRGEGGPAASAVLPLMKAAQAAGCVGDIIECRALLALAFEAQKKPTMADEAALAALRAAEGEGYLRVFVDLGPGMISILSRALSGAGGDAERLEAYVRRIKAAAALKPGAKTGAGASGLPERLSDRELEVLHLISSGLSNDEIAEKLFISSGTVKRHVHNIFGKLDAKSRTAAIDKAKKAGIL